MSSTEPAIYCLERVGRSKPGWDTLVVSGAAHTALPAGDLWAVWSDLEHWPLWSPLHKSVSRASSPSALTADATFDQRLSLGFPVGTSTQHVTISELEPARRAAWVGSGKGIRSCHLWSFTPLPGGTRVTNTEAFVGLPVAILGPLVSRRWNRAFQDAVDGLIRHAASWHDHLHGERTKARPSGRTMQAGGSEWRW